MNATAILLDSEIIAFSALVSLLIFVSQTAVKSCPQHSVHNTGIVPGTLALFSMQMLLLLAPLINHQDVVFDE